MKRKLIVLMALLMTVMVFMTGCGSKEDVAVKPSEKPAGEAAEEPEEEPEETPEEEQGEEEQVETPESTVPGEVLGVLAENGYTNDFFGIKYEAPEGWYVFTKEELGELLGITASSIDDDSLREMYESDGYAMDLYAVNAVQVASGDKTYDNVNITIQDIGKIYGFIYNEKEIAEASVETVKESLAAQGVSDIATEIGEMEFMGKTCVYMMITSKAGDIPMYQKQVYLKNGSGMACVTASTFNEDRTDEVLAVFQAK